MYVCMHVHMCSHDYFHIDQLYVVEEDSATKEGLRGKVHTIWHMHMISDVNVVLYNLLA